MLRGEKVRPFTPKTPHLLSSMVLVVLRQEHTGPTVGRLKRLGRLRQVQEQICSVCSAELEAFGTVQMLSALIQHAKSERAGFRPSETLDSLIGCVSAV